MTNTTFAGELRDQLYELVENVWYEDADADLLAYSAHMVSESWNGEGWYMTAPSTEVCWWESPADLAAGVYSTAVCAGTDMTTAVYLGDDVKPEWY